MLLAVLYLGIRWLDFPNRVQEYLRESILPVYVIHHPVVLVVSSFVVTWSLGVWPKFALILVTVLTLTMVIYEFGVRRWAITRLLFGLGPAPEAVKQMREPRPADSPDQQSVVLANWIER